MLYLDEPLSSSAGTAVSSSYTSDTWTLLFDDFEGSTQADSLSATVAYTPGHRAGQGLNLPDTSAHAFYRESSWVGPGGGPDTENNKLPSGTIEFFFRPDTTMTSVSRSYLLSHRFSPPAALGRGQFTLAVLSGTALEWSQGWVAAFGTIQHNPPLNPGQWYHVAVTWDTTLGSALYVNGVRRANDSTAADVDSSFFYLGGGDSNSWTAPGTFDRLRISSRARTETEFPTALEIACDSPAGSAGGQTLYQPFSVSYSARASDSPSITVKILLTEDTESLTGTAVKSGLSGIDTVTLSGLTAGRYRLIAVAQTSSETAYAATDFLSIQPDTSNAAVNVGQSDEPNACLLARHGWSGGWLRSLRDLLLESRIGRLLTEGYYLL